MLSQHMDVFTSLSREHLVSPDVNGTVDARLFYYFETKSGRRLLDVVIWSIGSDIAFSNIVINGRDFMWDSIFLEIILPFLPNQNAEIFRQILSSPLLIL